MGRTVGPADQGAVSIELDHDQRTRVGLGERSAGHLRVRLPGQHLGLLLVRQEDIDTEIRGHRQEVLDTHLADHLE